MQLPIVQSDGELLEWMRELGAVELTGVDASMPHVRGARIEAGWQCILWLGERQSSGWGNTIRDACEIAIENMS